MLIYVCSPFRAPTPTQRWANLDLARAACREIVLAGHDPIAPHLFYPQFLNDDDPNERAAGLLRCRDWIRRADVVYVFRHNQHDWPSQGMKHDIDFAQENGKPVEYRTLGQPYPAPSASNPM